jgi:hypothetical protein
MGTRSTSTVRRAGTRLATHIRSTPGLIRLPARPHATVHSTPLPPFPHARAACATFPCALHLTRSRYCEPTQLQCCCTTRCKRTASAPARPGWSHGGTEVHVAVCYVHGREGVGFKETVEREVYLQLQLRPGLTSQREGALPSCQSLLSLHHPAEHGHGVLDTVLPWPTAHRPTNTLKTIQARGRPGGWVSCKTWDGMVFGHSPTTTPRLQMQHHQLMSLSRKAGGLQHVRKRG